MQHTALSKNSPEAQIVMKVLVMEPELTADCLLRKRQDDCTKMVAVMP